LSSIRRPQSISANATRPVGAEEYAIKTFLAARKIGDDIVISGRFLPHDEDRQRLAKALLEDKPSCAGHGRFPLLEVRPKHLDELVELMVFEDPEDGLDRSLAFLANATSSVPAGDSGRGF